MSETFEGRLRSALRAGAEDAPGVSGVADAARTRLRRRRLTTAGAAVAVAVVAAVPVGAVLLDREGSGDGSNVVADQPGWIPDGWRSESWHTAEFAVPAEWRYGAPSQWCVGGGQPTTPVIQGPDTVSTQVLCPSPAEGFGVSFLGDASGSAGSSGPTQTDGDGRWPAGSWVATVAVGDVGIQIVTGEESLTRQIVDSVHEIEGVDANGCAPTAPMPEAGAMAPSDPPAGGALALCRYSPPATEASGDVQLVGSKRLTEAQASDVLTALELGADGTEVVYGECAALVHGGSLITQGGVPLAWVIDTSCAGSAVDRGGEVLPLTEEIRDAVNAATYDF